MTIRAIVDLLEKEIQNHQASIRRLQKRKAELIAAANEAFKKNGVKLAR